MHLEEANKNVDENEFKYNQPYMPIQSNDFSPKIIKVISQLFSFPDVAKLVNSIESNTEESYEEKVKRICENVVAFEKTDTNGSVSNFITFNIKNDNNSSHILFPNVSAEITHKGKNERVICVFTSLSKEYDTISEVVYIQNNTSLWFSEDSMNYLLQLFSFKVEVLSASNKMKYFSIMPERLITPDDIEKVTFLVEIGKNRVNDNRTDGTPVDDDQVAGSPVMVKSLH